MIPLIAAVVVETLALTWLGYRIGQDLKRRREHWEKQLESIRDMHWKLERKVFKRRSGDSVLFALYSDIAEPERPTIDERLTALEAKAKKRK